MPHNINISETIKNTKMEKLYKDFVRDKYPKTDGLLNTDVQTFAIEFGKYITEQSRQQKLVECSNCGDKVEMVSSGEFCPRCFC